MYLTLGLPPSLPLSALQSSGEYFSDGRERVSVDRVAEKGLDKLQDQMDIFTIELSKGQLLWLFLSLSLSLSPLCIYVT